MKPAAPVTTARMIRIPLPVFGRPAEAGRIRRFRQPSNRASASSGAKVTEYPASAPPAGDVSQSVSS